MTTRVSPIGVDVERIESELRPLQMDMIALALQGKQLHWNLQGRQFMSLHMQLDGIVDDARGWVDELAERLVTLGVWPTASPRTWRAKARWTKCQRGPCLTWTRWG
jgi:starvation-inducible DNA-binding protein